MDRSAVRAAPTRGRPQQLDVLRKALRDRGSAEVLLLGDLNVDLTLEVPSWPRPGGEGVASTQRIGVGGSAANTAIMLSRLGLRTSMLSCIGSDSWGSVASDGMAVEGVGLDHVVRHRSEPTSLNIVAVTPDGERTMLAYRGASAQYRSGDVPVQSVGAVDLLHVSAYALLEDPQAAAAVTAVRRASGSGVPVSLDVPVDPAQRQPELIRQLLPLVDLLIVGEPEAEALTRTSGDPRALCQELHDLGAATVALKLGAAGCVISTPSGRARAEPLDVEVVDTTGAGDSFAAGLIAAHLADLSVEATAWTANLLGAGAVTRAGAGRDLPTLDQLGVLGHQSPFPA